MTTSIDVKYQGKVIPVDFESSANLESTSVRDLKMICERMTGVTSSDIKLMAFGVPMKNDDLTLKHYHIRPGCFVTMKVKKKKAEKKLVNKEDDELMTQLHNISKRVHDLQPQVDSYDKAVRSFSQQSEKTSKEKKKHVYNGAYLGEQLMHVLFDLDGTLCGADQTDARQLRKQTVKEAQILLDKVDELKSIVKHIHVPDEQP